MAELEETKKEETLDTPVTIEEIFQQGDEPVDRVLVDAEPESFGEDMRPEVEQVFDGWKDFTGGITAEQRRSAATSIVLLGDRKNPDQYSESKYTEAEDRVLSAKSPRAAIDSELQAMQFEAGNAYKANIANIGQENPSLLPLFQETDAILAKAQDDAQGVLAEQKALIQIYAGKSLSESVKDDQATEGYAGELVKAHFRKNDGLDLTWDGVSLLFHPMVNLVEFRDVAIALDPDFSGDPFDAMKKSIKAFQSSNVATQRAMVPKILKALISGHNNNQFQVQAGMAMYFDPEFSKKIETEKSLEAAEAGLFFAFAPINAGMKMVNGIKRLFSPVTRFKNMDNPRKAVQVSKTIDPPDKQARDAHSSNWEQTLMGAGKSDDGLNVAHQELADEIMETIVKPLQDIRDPKSFIKAQALSPEQQDKAIAAVQASKKVNDHTVISSELLSRDRSGYKMKWSVEGKVSGSGTGKPREIVKEYTFQLDDAGAYAAYDRSNEISNSALIGGKALSPDVILNPVADGIVDRFTFGQNQASKIKNSMIKIANKTEDALKSLPILQFKAGKAVWVRGDARRKVNELVIAGDEAGEVFTMERAMAGAIETASDKVPVSKEVYKAYLSKVAYNEESWEATNYLIRQAMKFDGVREGRWINSATKNVEKRPMKPTDSIDEWGAGNDELILAPGLASKGANFAHRGAINVEEAVKDMGYQMATLQQPIRYNGKVIRKALLPTNGDNGLFDLPAELLHRRAGQVTRIRKPGYYYAKDTETGHTYGVFKTSEAAESFGKQISAGFKAAGDDIDIRAVRDQDFTKLDALDALANQHGGLIYGKRSTNKIFVDDAIEAGTERLSVGQSMQRMLENVSNRMPLDEFRMSSVRSWQESAVQMLKQHGLKEGDDILKAVKDNSKWTTVRLNSINDPKAKRMLETHRDWLIDNLSIPLDEEKVWTRFMYDWAGTMSEGKFRDAIVNMGSQNPVSAFKAAVFNPYLGFFNARQLYIQMQNASLAASMYPIQAVTAVPQAFIQKLFWYMGKGTYDDLIKQSAKGIIPEKGIKDLIVSLEQAKRSGIFDGINQIDMVGSTVSGFGGGTWEAVKMAAQKGRFFFEQGEQMARLISWNIARKNWISKNPGKAIDDTAIEFIHSDTLRMNMNMQTANAAQFQKHVITGPLTQFFPVQAKMVENVVGGIMGGGRWSRREASQAVAGQIVLYGTLGVPFAEDAATWLTQKLGSNPAELQGSNPNIHKLVNQGMTGVMFNAMGFENNFSTDGNLLVLDKSVPVDLLKSIHKMVTGDQSSIDLKAPLFGILQRTNDAMMDAWNAGRAIAISPSFATLQEGVAETLSGVVAVTSAWSNARKLRYAWKTGNLLTRKGVLIAGKGEIAEVNGRSMVMAAFGMKLDLEDEFYRQKLWEMDEAKAVRDTMKALRKVENNFLLDHNFEKKQKMTSALLAEWEGNPSKKWDIEGAILNETLFPKSERSKQLQRLYTEMIQGGSIDISSTLLAADYIETNE